MPTQPLDLKSGSDLPEYGWTKFFIILGILNLAATAGEPSSTGGGRVDPKRDLQSENAEIDEKLRVSREFFKIETYIKSRYESEKLKLDSIKNARIRAKGILTQEVYFQLEVGIDTVANISKLTRDNRLTLLKLHKNLTNTLKTPLEKTFGRLEISKVAMLLRSFTADKTYVKSEKVTKNSDALPFKDMFFDAVGIPLNHFSDELKLSIEKTFRDAHDSKAKTNSFLDEAITVLPKLQPQVLNRLADIVKDVTKE